ncbi:RdgB/HAM1 family non-canonical purine NTP pyrophosphatase [Mycoplasmatota bacterium zrk1]
MHKRNSLFIATRNKGKLKDFKSLLPKYHIRSLLDTDIPEIEETGTTFQENSLIKAKTISNLLNTTVIADDSGLVCEGLDGEPGVYSARYAGTNSDEDNNKLLLRKIKDENRNAEFVACICLYFPSGDYYFFLGKVKGEIIDTPKGNNGFGYDPIFYVKEFDKTFGELSLKEKNTISHRKKAIQKLIESSLL